MSKIKSIHAREILDSRGNPTLETHIELASGAYGYSQVPSGASTGIHEAWELRDGGQRYGGRGVLKAVKNVNEKIARKLYGVECSNLEKIDRLMIELDKSKNKKNLGANAILSVSLAAVRAVADDNNLSLNKFIEQYFDFNKTKKLPRPMMNILNGGRHADNEVSVQEFMIVPKAPSMSKMIQIGVEVYHELRKILQIKKLATGLGDEGGFAPRVKSAEEALDLLMMAISKSGYKPGRDVELALDVAASEFYKSKKYVFKKKNLGSLQLIKIYESWLKKYPLISIEDGLDQDDWEGWKEMTEKLGNKALLVGDDIFVTNINRLQTGLKRGVGNSILIKLNQIGTFSETIDVIKLARENSYQTIVSHRSGETGDDFIADLTVGSGSGFIKAGAPARGERLAKYNRLLAIFEKN